VTQTKLKDAIINKLSELNIKIYDETVKQGFQEPCFFVQFLINTHRHLLDNRYQRLNTVEIMYFSDNPRASKEDYDNMAEILFEKLRYLVIDDGDEKQVIRATGDITSEVIDDVLHLTVNYDYHLKVIEDKTKMQIYESEVEINE